MKLLESGEDYLERILVLKQEKGKIRAIDIVHDMAYSKASVSIGLKKLKDNHYIVINSDGFIDFTPDGLEIAESILERHKVISKLLERIGVDEKTALQEACKIEHDISDETFQLIKKHSNL